MRFSFGRDLPVILQIEGVFVGGRACMGELQALIDDIRQPEQQVGNFAAAVVVVERSDRRRNRSDRWSDASPAPPIVLVGHGEKREVWMRIEMPVFVSELRVVPAVCPGQSLNNSSIFLSRKVSGL